MAPSLGLAEEVTQLRVVGPTEIVVPLDELPDTLLAVQVECVTDMGETVLGGEYTLSLIVYIYASKLLFQLYFTIALGQRVDGC